jgi:hypothetical protein
VAFLLDAAACAMLPAPPRPYMLYYRKEVKSLRTVHRNMGLSSTTRCVQMYRLLAVAAAAPSGAHMFTYRMSTEESDMIATWGSLSRRSALRNVGFDDHRNWSVYLAQDKTLNRAKLWKVVTRRRFHVREDVEQWGIFQFER